MAETKAPPQASNPASPQVPDVKLPDPVEMSRAMTRIAEQSQRLVSEFLARQAADGAGPKSPDPMGVGHAFLEMTNRHSAFPFVMILGKRSTFCFFINRSNFQIKP